MKYIISIILILSYALALKAEDSAVTTTQQKQSVDLIIEGEYVLTMAQDGKATPIENGAIAIKDGKIVAVDKRTAIAEQFSASEVVAGDNRILMPGLINGHTHSAMTLFRGVADDLPLMEWLTKYIFPMEGRFVDREFVALGIELACLEMIKGGTTTFADMYFYPGTAFDVIDRCGMRAILGAPMIDFPSPGYEGWEDSYAQGLKFVKDMKARAHPRITPALAPHAPYTVAPDHLELVVEMAKAEDVPILMHLAEDRAETKTITERYGKTPVSHAASLGMLSHPMVAAHVVYPTEDEIKMLADSPVGAIHNPTSNLKTGAGIAPIPAMLKAGVKVGLGTDGAASNNDLDMWEEIRLAALLHKGVTNDPTVTPAIDALRMATSLGAAAINMADDIGSLEVGKRADMIQISLDAPHLAPLYDIISHLVYAVHNRDVVTTVIEGRVLMRDGVVESVDADDVLKRAREKAAEIKAALVQ